MPNETENHPVNNVIVLANSQTELCYQFRATAQKDGCTAEECRRFLILTLLKWVYDKTEQDHIGFSDDPNQYAVVPENRFASFKAERPNYGVNVSALEATGEWAVRFRFPGSKNNHLTFTSRIALRNLDETRVEIGCYDSVTIPDYAPEFDYGYRPSWLSSLLNVGTFVDAPVSGITFAQADTIIDPHHVQYINSKTACKNMIRLWNNPQNLCPFVFIAEPAPKAKPQTAALCRGAMPSYPAPVAKASAIILPPPVPSARILPVPQLSKSDADYMEIAANYTRSAGGYARVWLIAHGELEDFKQRTGITVPEGGAVIVDPQCFVGLLPAMRDCVVKPSYRNMTNTTTFNECMESTRKRNLGQSVNFNPLRFEAELAPLCAAEQFEKAQQVQTEIINNTIEGLQLQLKEVMAERDKYLNDYAVLRKEHKDLQEKWKTAEQEAGKQLEKAERTYKKDLKAKQDYCNDLLRQLDALQTCREASSLPNSLFFKKEILPVYCSAAWPQGRTDEQAFRNVVDFYCLVHGITLTNNYEVKPKFLSDISGVPKTINVGNYADQLSFLDMFCDRLAHDLDYTRTAPSGGEKLYGGDNQYHFCVSGAGRIFYHFKCGEARGCKCLILDKYDSNHSEE